MNTVVTREEAQQEVDKNYDYFRKKLPELKEYHLNQFALLHRQKIIDFYNDEDDAIKVGKDKYGSLGNFSVQEVTERSLELGFQAYVVI